MTLSFMLTLIVKHTEDVQVIFKGKFDREVRTTIMYSLSVSQAAEKITSLNTPSVVLLVSLFTS